MAIATILKRNKKVQGAKLLVNKNTSFKKCFCFSWAVEEIRTPSENSTNSSAEPLHYDRHNHNKSG